MRFVPTAAPWSRPPQQDGILTPAEAGELSTRSVAQRWGRRGVHGTDVGTRRSFPDFSQRWSRGRFLLPLFYSCWWSNQTSFGAMLEEGSEGRGHGRGVDQIGKNQHVRGWKRRSVGERWIWANWDQLADGRTDLLVFSVRSSAELATLERSSTRNSDRYDTIVIKTVTCWHSSANRYRPKQTSL